jgi:D-3-phosphoglycerate dehydrogenase
MPATPLPILLIAESKDFDPSSLELLRSHFEVRLTDLDHAGLLREVGDVDLLWVRLRNMVDAEVINRAPRLQAVITNTTGLNHIDLASAQRRGIQIISLQGEVEFLKTIRATAELTMGLTLALLRKIPAAHAHAIGGDWDRDQFSGREIYQMDVGIVGYGRLGSIVAKYFQAFGAKVAVCDPKLEGRAEVDSFTVLSMSQLLQRSDLVSLHVNYEPRNHHLINRTALAQMKRGAYLVNTARGELVDETALVDVIPLGHLSGVALDVIEHEYRPLPSLAALRELAARGFNVVLTPHIGGNTLESTARTERFLAEKVLQWATAARVAVQA